MISASGSGKKVKVEAYEGDTVNISLNWLDAAGVQINLSGYSANMHIKRLAGDALPLVSLSSQESGIVLSADLAANIAIEISAAQTNSLGAGQFVFDLKMTDPSGDIETVLAGSLQLNKSVTQL